MFNGGQMHGGIGYTMLRATHEIWAKAAGLGQIITGRRQ
jgi:hypothetical protein